MALIETTSNGSILTEEKIREIVEIGTPSFLYEGRRVPALTPDGTRTCRKPFNGSE